MTDTQLIEGIKHNDEHTWRYICRSMRQGFTAIIKQTVTITKIADDDIDDIFQESLILLMQKVKSGDIVAHRDGGLFHYLVEIGKWKVRNLQRKQRMLYSDSIVVSALNAQKIDEQDAAMTIDEMQHTQDKFLDRVLDLLPLECKTLLKLFYWNHKPMDEIASILGMCNADSAKSKKSKCMNKVKDIATQLLENDEFAEEAVRNAVERAALRAIIDDEKIYADNSICMAALDVEDQTKE